MPDSKPKPEFKELFDLAKTKKVLTYDEIHKHLPGHIMDESQIDELLLKIVTEFNCELVDYTKKNAVPDVKARDIEIDKHDDDDEEDEIKAEADTLVRGNDPVKMYLHEMGGVSLLTREGEVEIAKRIELGEQQVFTVIIGCPVTIKEVLTLGDKLRRGTIRVKEVIRGFEDEEMPDGDDSAVVERILALIQELKDREAKYQIGRAHV